MNITDKITITNEDNMALMARYPDNYFDLAIVDPPYGLGIAKNGLSKGGGGKGRAPQKKYSKKNWDNSIPDSAYFTELMRVSKNQIIWGGNYFLDHLPSTPCLIVWDKDLRGYSLAQIEVAWTSFKKASDLYKYIWAGFRQGPTCQSIEKRIHPTQKPVALYKWLLDKYAKEGNKILDTHLGSGSISIACHDYGFELTACELDSEYYEKAIERIKNHVSQQKLF